MARAVGVGAERVRRCRRAWEQGGASALRRRAATGRPPKLDDAQLETVRAALAVSACGLHGMPECDEADSYGEERGQVNVPRDQHQ
ncbi:helix-turn-helix domain-containing protein [Streptomyces sp. NPDC059215]|uniref:helix-turn-helix domain-containing protein n=1 Tax=Streptomyces sp. NPDC059215 TaxID=3346772 RepID=UPI00369AEBAA